MFENIQVHVRKNFIFSNIYLFIYGNYNNVAYEMHAIMFLNLFKLFGNPEIKCSEMFVCSRDLKALPSNVSDIYVRVHQLQSLFTLLVVGNKPDL